MGKRNDPRFSDWTPANRLITRYRQLQREGKSFSKRVLVAEFHTFLRNWIILFTFKLCCHYR